MKQSTVSESEQKQHIKDNWPSKTSDIRIIKQQM